MKHLKISLFLLGIIVSIVACQQSFEDDFGVDPETLSVNGENIAALKARGCSADITPEFMPLNVIPEWAEDKMTPEEYELWKVMSTKFKIDYSFLKRPSTEENRESLYESINTIVNNIKDGVISEYAGLFTVMDNPVSIEPHNIETLSTPEDEKEMKYWETEKQYIYYSENSGITLYARVGYTTMDAEFLCINYIYEELSENASKMNASFAGTLNADLLTGTKNVLKIEATGPLIYNNPENGERREEYFPTQRINVYIRLK